MASTHHTLKDTKETYIHAFSLKLGELAHDVRQAIQHEKLDEITNPVRSQARLSRSSNTSR